MKDKYKNGFTLIEIILSIAILGIVAIFAVTIFGSSLKNISRSGKRTKEVFELESKINEKISEADGEDIIEVNIPGIGPKEIKGKIIIIQSESQDNMEITTFAPNKVQE